jgi:hypothetical protein
MIESGKNKESSALPMEGLGSRAQQFSLRLYGQKQDTKLLLHNYAFAASLAEEVSVLAAGSGSPEEASSTALLAAWFLPTGYLFDYHNPAPYSLKVAQQFLQQSGVPEPAQRPLLSSLQRVLRQEGPTNEAERLLQDAVSVQTFLTVPEERLPLLRLERELMLETEYTKADWASALLQELLDIKLYTHHGQAHYQPVLAKAIHQQQAEVEKRAEKEELKAGPYTSLEKKEPLRGAQTYFRTNYRNHINLSAIADNKANIMISVNAILVSVLITFLSYRNIGENAPHILLPVIIFLVTGLASLIFAVLSARPKVTKLNPEGSAASEVKKNIVFFGNFVHLPVEEYEAAMDELFQDSSLLYGNMVRDLYYLGKVLDKKYRFLSISYNIFMVGFAATVISFLAALFF